ncbi:MAG TPA: hypothetical protein VN635_01745 [Conexibacter sp.]|nr:hypothetical protein [Conexibacter sp.]
MAHQIHLALDDESAARLAALAERAHAEQDDLAVTLLSEALAELEREPADVVSVLDRVPGAWERMGEDGHRQAVRRDEFLRSSLVEPVDEKGGSAAVGCKGQSPSQDREAAADALAHDGGRGSETSGCVYVALVLHDVSAHGVQLLCRKLCEQGEHRGRRTPRRRRVVRG